MAALQALPRPRAVSASFWCWLAGSLLVGAIVALASTKIEPMRAEFAQLTGTSDPAAAQATIDKVATASVLLVIGSGAMLGLLALALAGAMWAGKPWARVVLAALALTALAYAVFVSIAMTDAMLGDLRDAVSGGLLAYSAVVLVAAVCMYLPGTGPWFRRPRGR
jgi:predicted nicotinamide N-methyase